MAALPVDTVITPRDVAVRSSSFRYLEWGPIFAGALCATAISFVLLAFGSALGLSAVSPYPYRGLSASTFMIVAALFVAMVQVCSYAAGGYLAGRMRAPWLDGVLAERHFRDGVHGFAVWALSLVFTAGLLASGAGGMLKAATDATATVAAGVGAGATNHLSLDPADYATDFLLRPAPVAVENTTPANATAAPATTMTANMSNGAMSVPVDRAPITRVFAASLKNGALAAPDRTYLAEVVARQNGVSQAEAGKRVDTAYVEAQKTEQKTRDLANAARKKAALAGFLTAATFAVACAAACVAAGLGGRDRDEEAAEHTHWMGTARFG